MRYNLEEVFYKKGKIIIIDDNKMIAKSLKKLAESYLLKTNKKYELGHIIK